MHPTDLPDTSRHAPGLGKRGWRCVGRVTFTRKTRCQRKWPKHPILARFWQFLKRPMRDLYENAVKCSFRRARFTGAIRLDVQFGWDLSPKRARGADATDDEPSERGSIFRNNSFTKARLARLRSPDPTPQLRVGVRPSVFPPAARKGRIQSVLRYQSGTST